MPASPNGSPQTDYSSLPFFLGFLGVAGAFSLLPKTMRRGLRRLVLGIFFEITVVVLAGLLTERMVSYITRENDEEHLPEPPRHR